MLRSRLPYDEDQLPEGQAFIRTHNVERFEMFMETLLHLYTSPYYKATMALVHGDAGIGKTIMARQYQHNYAESSITGQSRCLMLKVRSRTTGKALALDFGGALGETFEGNNVFVLADEVSEAIIRNDVDVTLVDEGNRLDEGSFDVLRSVFDLTGRPIVVLGLSSLLEITEGKDKELFGSRIGMRLPLEPITREELITTVLPRMCLPGWHFDPVSVDDQALASRLHVMMGKSLRTLRNILQAASAHAHILGDSKITWEHIQRVFRWAGTRADHQRYRRHNPDRPATDEPENPQRGPYEEEAERKQDAQEYGRNGHRDEARDVQ